MVPLSVHSSVNGFQHQFCSVDKIVSDNDMMSFYCKCIAVTIILTSIAVAKRTKKKEENVPVITREDMRRNGIFSSLNSILEYLKLPEYRSRTAVKEMIKKYRKSLHIGKQLTDFLPGPRRRFVVIEGLYTSKRNAVAKLVARIIGGKHILNPFRKLAGVSHLPATFDTRRAYYSLTKYGIANLVPKVLQTHPVIMERYWLDQATFAIAKTFKKEFPPAESDLFAWPKDLIKPDLTFFINADKKSTDEYTLPNEVNNFTLNILKAYDNFKQRMPIHEISSNQLLMDMAKKIMTEMRLLGEEVVVVKKTDYIVKLPD